MSVQIKPEQSYAYSELLEILDLMEEEYVSKIPNKLLDIFKNNSDANYKKHIDPDVPLENQNLSQKTSALLAMLMLNYWCENEEQKQELKNMFEENEQKYQKELREKYNPDNIFNNQASSIETNLTDTEQKVDNQNLPIDYNNFPWYKKIFTKIRTFFYRIFKTEKNPS